MKKLTFKCEFCKIWLPLLVLLVAGFYVAWQFVPAAAADKVTIALAGMNSTYNNYAKQYQQQLKADNITLDIVSVAGSVEALQTLKQGQTDFALVQGGVAYSVMKDAAAQGLHSIASLFYEPLWVFYRKELGEVSHLNALRGKRLSIGPQGSGTQVLVSQLLADNDITSENTRFTPLLIDEAAAKLQAGELDAMFVMASPKSDLISTLITHPDIALMDFQHQVITYTSHYPFLSSLTLGEGIISLKNNLPDHNITLLATTATLVARKDIHPDHVRLLSREILKIHSKPALLEQTRQFPSIDHLDIPVHTTAQQYLENGPSWLEKVFPFWLSTRLDQLKVMLIPLLTLLVPLSKGIMPLYQWRIRSRIYPWYKTLSQLDRKLDSLDLAATEQEISRLQKLHGELAASISVPLAHMPEFYNLRTHTDHILTRLKEHRLLLLGETAMPVASVTNPPSTPVAAIPNVKKVRLSAILTSSKPARATSAIKNTTLVSTPEGAGNTDEPALTTSQMSTSNPSVSIKETEAQPEDTAPSLDIISMPVVAETWSLPEPLTAHQQQYDQAQRMVRQHLLAGTAMSAIPLPMLDVAALMSTQLHLLDKLSQHYAIPFDKKLARLKLLALLGSMLPATTLMGLSSLSKLIPGIGTIAGGVSVSALSGAMIYATGSVFIRHFAAGGTLESFDSKKQRLSFRQNLRRHLHNQSHS